MPIEMPIPKSKEKRISEYPRAVGISKDINMHNENNRRRRNRERSRRYIQKNHWEFLPN
jgi:hypothetical protein